MDRWAVNLAEAIKGKQKSNGKITPEYFIAKVSSTHPFVLEINGQTITEYIYANPAYLAKPPAVPAQDEISNALLAFVDSFVLHAGDAVVVIMVGNSFYVLEKAG